MHTTALFVVVAERRGIALTITHLPLRGHNAPAAAVSECAVARYPPLLPTILATTRNDYCPESGVIPLQDHDGPAAAESSRTCRVGVTMRGRPVFQSHLFGTGLLYCSSSNICASTFS
jgi:hypothetical protein